MEATSIVESSAHSAGDSLVAGANRLPVPFVERVAALSENGIFIHEVVSLSDGRYAFITHGDTYPLYGDDPIELLIAVDETRFFDGTNINNVSLAQMFVPVFEHFLKKEVAAPSPN